MYGNIQRVRRTVSSNFPGVARKPFAKSATIGLGEEDSERHEPDEDAEEEEEHPARVDALLARALALHLLRHRDERPGRPPSPTIARNVFGIRNAV